jgi:hypothetical protein
MRSKGMFGSKLLKSRCCCTVASAAECTQAEMVTFKRGLGPGMLVDGEDLGTLVRAQGD